MLDTGLSIPFQGSGACFYRIKTWIAKKSTIHKRNYIVIMERGSYNECRNLGESAGEEEE